MQEFEAINVMMDSLFLQFGLVVTIGLFMAGLWVAYIAILAALCCRISGDTDFPRSLAAIVKLCRKK